MWPWGDGFCKTLSKRDNPQYQSNTESIKQNLNKLNKPLPLKRFFQLPVVLPKPVLDFLNNHLVFRMIF